MTMKGQAVPACVWPTRVKQPNGEYDWKQIESSEIFKGKRVVVFALPGAFTPTCSSTHLPGYEDDYDAIKAKKVDEVYCLSVNDTFVMNAWAKELGATKVKVIADGSGEFTKGMGMLVDKTNLGFGMRSWRYSMVVNDGKVEEIFIEGGAKQDKATTDPFEVSDSQSMLKYLSA